MSQLRFAILLIAFVLAAVTQTGCASFGKKMKAFLGGKSEAPTTAANAPKTNGVKFSDNPNMASPLRRQYKRTTKQSLEDESQLSSTAGSLWVMEGQGAFLFAQNIVRMVGDSLVVQLEGEPKEQLQAKVDVIRKLLNRLEERNRMRAPAAEGEKDKAAANAPAAGGQNPPAQNQQSAQQAANDKAVELAVKSVPTRIVERTIDGNYRVKGTQPFMIGPREYKIIVTGIVRAEDFNDEGIAASKLMDSKFDVVSARRKETEI